MAKDTSYTSDATKFINSLFKKDPQLHQKQEQLRDTWWDQGFINQEQQDEFNRSQLKADGYSYYSYNHDKN